jgi:LmbE family N-acetylglucosaminyl deacetylase
MIRVSMDRVTSLLCIGAHCDDIEIGCGGTVLSMVRSNPSLSVTWIVLSSDQAREAEARESAQAFLAGVDEFSFVAKQFRNGFFPYEPSLKEYFEEVKATVSPDLILTHRREDRHQDHRATCDLTWNTFRDHLILEYEIPKWDGDVGQPNLYMQLDEWAAKQKIETLMKSFPSQRNRHWYDEETFRGLMRLRGMECRSPSRYAEAFFGPKIALSP